MNPSWLFTFLGIKWETVVFFLCVNLCALLSRFYTLKFKFLLIMFSWVEEKTSVCGWGEEKGRDDIV